MSRASYLRRPLTALLVAAALAASVLMAAVVLASPAQAATLTVTTAADERNTNNQCSLREAIINANQDNQSGSADCPAGVAEDTINFNLVSPATITLGSPLPSIIAISQSSGLIIDGGSADITISGDNKYRVFEVAFAKVTLSNLTVANGNAAGAGGGGIYNFGDTLTVSNSTISGNVAFGGGGIYNEPSGTLTVSNSTLSGNSSSSGGGGIVNGGTLTVSNSTLSGNSASGGGGIWNNGGTLTLSNSTLSGNSSSPGDSGSILNNNTATLKNTIVSGGSCLIVGGTPGTFNDGGNNLDSGTSCGFSATNNSLSSTDPMLGPLADNGGPTKTHALLAGSPAIDKGVAVAGITTDQRGVARPQGPAPDIGAFEFFEDTISPSGTVLINNGAARTNSTAVTLKLSATDPAPSFGVAQMRFSNNGSTWSGWEAYATTKGWTLGNANGTKTVYAQFKDGAGNVSVAAQDAIVLDTIKPTVSGLQPAAGATNVSIGANVVATFSETMQKSTLTNPANFKLYRRTATGSYNRITNVTLTTNVAGTKVTLNPYGDSATRLARNTTYKAEVTTGVKDLSGNAMAANQVWTFKTVS